MSAPASAPAPVTIHEADGVLPVRIVGTTGDEVTVDVDVYEAVGVFGEVYRQHQDNPAAYVAGLRAAVQSLGFPPLAQRTAVQIREAVYARLAALKKADAGSTTSG